MVCEPWPGFPLCGIHRDNAAACLGGDHHIVFGELVRQLFQFLFILAAGSKRLDFRNAAPSLLANILLHIFADQDFFRMNPHKFCRRFPLTAEHRSCHKYLT